MNIFRKRPLSLILCIWLAVFFLFSLNIHKLRIGLLVFSFLPLIISFILRFSSRTKYLLRFATLASILAILFSYAYFDLHFSVAEQYDGEVNITGTVVEVAPSSSYSNKVTLKTKSIDGDSFARYKITLYLDKSDSGKMPAGTEISFNAKLCSFSAKTRSYNISIGVAAYADDVKNLTINSYNNSSLQSRIAYYKEYLSRYIILRTDSDSGAMLSALLLGNRDYLSPQVRLDFQRIGISHLLALSGLHLAILSLGVGKLLSAIGVRKKWRLGIISLFTLGYIALTGFSVSVMRAGFMLIISSVLFLFSHKHDSVTSLAVAVTVICLVNPCSIFSVSLWLSALATLGIITLGEYTSSRMRKNKKPLKSILHYIWLGIMSSVFAISSTLAISSFTFGSMSIIGIFTTLIFSLIVELLMYLGCIRAILGVLFPFNWLISLLTGTIEKLAEICSSGKFVSLSTNYLPIAAAIVVYTVIFYLFIILPINNRRKYIITLVILFAVVTILPIGFAIFEDNDDKIIYLSDTKSDQLLIRSNNMTCLINSSQYAKNLAYTTEDLLNEARVTYLDHYYLTHYSWSIDDELKTLLSDIMIKRIYLPVPRNDDELTILKVVAKAVEDYRTKIVLFDELTERVRVGDYHIELLHSVPYGEGTSMNAFSVTSDTENILYISSGLLDSEDGRWITGKIGDCTTLILGEHGKKYKKPVYIYGFYPKIKHMIVDSSNAFLTQSNMLQYLDNGCEILSHPKQPVYIEK